MEKRLYLFSEELTEMSFGLDKSGYLWTTFGFEKKRLYKRVWLFILGGLKYGHRLFINRGLRRPNAI